MKHLYLVLLFTVVYSNLVKVRLLDHTNHNLVDSAAQLALLNQPKMVYLRVSFAETGTWKVTVLVKAVVEYDSFVPTKDLLTAEDVNQRAQGACLWQGGSVRWRVGVAIIASLNRCDRGE